MSRTRLGAVARDLVLLLSGRTDEELRVVAQDVVAFGLARAPVAGALVDQGLQALQAGDPGDGGLREELEALVAELDERAWAAQEAWESGDAPEAAYAEAFGRARSAAAVVAALGQEPLDAALESVYEVQVGSGDLAAVTGEVLRVLGRPTAGGEGLPRERHTG